MTQELNVTPIEDKIIIRPDPVEEKTAGGIIIPDTAKERPTIGVIVGVGPGVYARDSGLLIPMQVSKGERVAYSPYAGAEMTHEGVDYIILRQTDLYYKL